MNPKRYIELKSAFTGTIDISQDLPYDFAYPRSLLTYLDGQILASSWKDVKKAFNNFSGYPKGAIFLNLLPKLFDDGFWHPILCGFFTIPPYPVPRGPLSHPLPPFLWHISFYYSISNVDKLSEIVSVFLPYSKHIRLKKILPMKTDNNNFPCNFPIFLSDIPSAWARSHPIADDEIPF